MNDNYETQEALPIARLSSHRPQAIQLPDDPRLATATVLAHVRGADSINRAAAIEALTVRVMALSNVDPQQAIEALAEQLPVLNSLWLLFAAESASAKSSEVRATYLRLALSAQLSYSRTQALVIGLRAQSTGQALVTLTDSQEDS